MRILFFGMSGAFSRIALESLLAAGVDVCAVVLPAPPGLPVGLRRAAPPAGLIPLASASGPALASLAWAHGIPLHELGRAWPEALGGLAALGAQAACVACWPRRIPPALLALPPHGFLNLHPSLLPAFRGPEPLFWVLRSGAQPGVTVHAMDAGLDTGDILAQRPVDLPDGIAGPAADVALAQAGGPLLAQSALQLAAGTLARRPQPPGGSYQGLPQPEDFALDVTWPARRAFRFMRGTAHWGQPYPIAVGGESLLLAAALAFDPGAQLAAPLVRAGDAVHIQLSPGVLTARCTETASRPA